MRTRSAAWFAWGSWTLTLALTLIGLALLTATSTTDIGERWGPRGITTPLTLSFATVGAFIVTRRSHNGIGWIFCGVGLEAAVVLFAEEYAVYALIAKRGALPGAVTLAWMAAWSWIPWAYLVPTVLPLVFPHGRLPSRRWRPLAWLAMANSALGALARAFAPGPLAFRTISNPFGIAGAGDLLRLALLASMLVAMLLSVAAVVSLLARWASSTGVERQQFKWFIYAATPSALATLAGDTIPVLGPFIFVGAMLSLPIGTGLAILRHHLYDIDLIINRTLVYGALTVALTGVYVGSVVALQGVVGSFAGPEPSSPVVVAATLLVAALFQPLRRRIQGAIDRRFYRRTYDAAKTLTAFSATLRDEVDLQMLSATLVAVVDETMQPAHVSLWVRPKPTIPSAV